jgi:heme a synthase
MTQRRFAGFAWGVLGYNVAVILWGAVVRATGSGAGCGGHWPECNGTIVPLDPSSETLIEYSHRLTSGVALLAVAALLVGARRRFPPGHRVRTAALAAMGVMVFEALIGAALVLFGWVGDDASAGRAIAIAVHLANTFLLLATLAITAWWASGRGPVAPRRDPALAWRFGAGLVGLVVVGAMGAVTALGNTLFPSESLTSGLREDLSTTAEVLTRLRVIHPVLAIAVSFFLFALARRLLIASGDPQVTRLARAVVALVGVQLLAGVLNVVLLAPVWMQLVHLLLADTLWVLTVLLGAAALAVPEAAEEGAGLEVSRS